MNKKIREILDISLISLNNGMLIEELDILNKNNWGNRKFIDKLIYKIMQKSNYKNLDEVKLLLNKYYPFLFNKDSEIKEATESIYKIIIDYGKSLISHRDGEIVYKYWKNDIDDEFIGPYEGFKKIDVFRIMNSAITMDIFTIIYLLENGVSDSEQLDNYYSRIYLADDQLDKVLKKGIAENHIHANAAFKFDFLWESLVNKNISKEQIEYKMYIDTDEKIERKFYKYILWAIFYRIIVLLYLKLSDLKVDICQFYNIERENIELGLYEKIILSLNCEFDELTEDDIKNGIDEIKKEYINNAEIDNENLVFEVLGNKKMIRTHGENIFLFETLKAYNCTKRNDLVLFKSLLNYLRIKNELYKKIVQNLSIKGLDNFSFYFNRAKIYNKKVLAGEKYYEILFRTNFQDSNLKKFELRLSINDSKENFEKSMGKIFKQYKDVIDDLYIKCGRKDFPRIGIVYHFIKREDCSEDKCWLNSDDMFIRFKEIQESYENQLKVLLEVRKSIPELSYFILGIDAASLENNTPVQIFSPIYNKARDSSIDILTNYSNGNYIKNKSLRFTFHAGEDFRHMLSGMRRIEELLEHCKFKVGDRIGHATVLGIDVDKWIKENPIVIIPREEHLDNLLWIWGMYTKHINNNSPTIMYVEQEIYNIAKDIFGNMNGININVLYEAYLLRFKKFNINIELKDMLCNNDDLSMINEDKILCVKSNNNISQIWNSERIVHAYNCICYLKRLREPIYVQSNEKYTNIIKELRNIIINQLAIKGVVVEVNPTSNFFICEIDGLLDNQIYAINTINNMKNVIVNINTDDPLVLNNNISNEYCYMYYGMLERGIGREEALRWIDKIRENGMSTSFISDDITNEEYYSYLEKIIERLE